MYYKLSILFFIFIISISKGFCLNNVDNVISKFNSNLDNIKSNLSSGHLSSIKAIVLLQALEIRQNQVIIMQNKELFNLLQERSHVA
jgi:hypothetical protein